MYEAALDTGYLKNVRPFLDEKEIIGLPKDQTLLICTGSQGEPRAALSRIAKDEHQNVFLDEGDTVIYSSKIIPGNERSIMKVQNLLKEKNINIITNNKKIAKYAHTFGMKVIACDPFPGAPSDGIRMVELEELFEQSDVISLHCPLTPDSVNLVNAQRLAIMKSTACLVNTSRGQLIDSEALAIALNSGQIAGAGLDVLEAEPPPKDFKQV